MPVHALRDVSAMLVPLPAVLAHLGVLLLALLPRRPPRVH